MTGCVTERRLARGDLVDEPKMRLQMGLVMEQRVDRMQVWLDADGAKTTPRSQAKGLELQGGESRGDAQVKPLTNRLQQKGTERL